MVLRAFVLHSHSLIGWVNSGPSNLAACLKPLLVQPDITRCCREMRRRVPLLWEGVSLPTVSSCESITTAYTSIRYLYIFIFPLWIALTTSKDSSRKININKLFSLSLSFFKYWVHLLFHYLKQELIWYFKAFWALSTKAWHVIFLIYELLRSLDNSRAFKYILQHDFGCCQKKDQIITDWPERVESYRQAGSRNISNLIQNSGIGFCIIFSLRLSKTLCALLKYY